MDNVNGYKPNNQEIQDESRFAGLVTMLLEYYFEILELNLGQNTFTHLITPERGGGSLGILRLDFMVIAEKHIHPDDKQPFLDFFDRDQLCRPWVDGQRMTELYYRRKSDQEEYHWIHVRNIYSQENRGKLIYSCFHDVTKRKEEEVREKLAMETALLEAVALNDVNSSLFERLCREIRTPLNDIFAIAEIASHNNKSQDKSQEYFVKIVKSSRLMTSMLEDFQRNFEKNSDTDLERDPPAYEDYPLDGKRVLLVEDNEVNRETVAMILEAYGIQVETAEDGKKAVLCFVSNPAYYYDFILMDVEMPLMDGHSATRCIRISGKDDAKSVPVFALSANAYQEDIKKSLECGMNAHISKPVEIGYLMKKMKEFLLSK